MAASIALWGSISLLFLWQPHPISSVEKSKGLQIPLRTWKCSWAVWASFGFSMNKDSTERPYTHNAANDGWSRRVLKLNWPRGPWLCLANPRSKMCFCQKKPCNEICGEVTQTTDVLHQKACFWVSEPHRALAVAPSWHPPPAPRWYRACAGSQMMEKTNSPAIWVLSAK